MEELEKKPIIPFSEEDSNDVKWFEIYIKYLKESEEELTVGNFIHWLKTFYVAPDSKN